MPPLAWVGAAVFAGGSLYMQNESRKAAKQANQLTAQRDDLSFARQRREAIRAARINFADSQQGGVNQGVGGGSTAQGALGSVFSQLNSNLSFLDTSYQLGSAANKALGRAQDYASYSNMFSDASSAIIGGIQGGFFDNFGKKSDT